MQALSLGIGRDLWSGQLIGGMVHAVMPGDRFKLAWVHAVYRAHIHPVLVWVRASLMMRVNPANFAKMMLRSVGSKAVDVQVLRPFYNFQLVEGHR